MSDIRTATGGPGNSGYHFSVEGTVDRRTAELIDLNQAVPSWRYTQPMRHARRHLNATILHQLGLDHERLTYRYGGRDYRLTDVHGRVVREVLA